MLVTTRFAPSPTGRLHFGNLRAALLSWLTARKAGGRFILRIDDTDRERSKEEHVDAIKRDLEWLGLGWDQFERQSERFERYEAAAARWREAGLLYPCYETPTELELRRKRQLAMGKPPVYDRAALTLTDAERRAFEAEGRKPHWRYKLSGERVVWLDQIRGETSVDLASVSDPVLIREDGGWLYTGSSVVDDVDMSVTHIVRGEDHVTNTASQFEMMRSLGGEVPTFAHHSLLVDPNGAALSKRDGSLTLEALRDSAKLEPMTVLSMMARLGSSDPIEPRADHASLIAGFDISKFGRSPARFDAGELAALNAKVLGVTPYAAVAERLGALDPALTSDALGEAFWLVIRDNLERIEDAADWARLAAEGARPEVAAEDAGFVAEAAAMLPPSPWNGETWGAWTKAVSAATGRKGKALFMPLRLALTGRARGPEMALLTPFLKPPRL